MDSELQERIQALDSAIWSALHSQGYTENPSETKECNDLMLQLENGSDFKNQEDKARFIALLQNIINRTMPGTQLFVRDCLLADEVSALYVPGVIFREPGFVDASSRHGGLLLTHRVMIISNHMANVGQILQDNTSWGLHVAPRKSYFKVMANYKSNSGKHLILLFHLPLDDSWKVLGKVEFNKLDEIDIVKTSIDTFERRHIEPPLPELATREWLQRCINPIGIDANNTRYPLEQ